MSVNLNNKLEFLITMSCIILLLMLPNVSPMLLELFDYSFTNFIVILVILLAIKTNIRYGISFTLLYAFALFQRRKNINRELIEKQISEIDITSLAKLSSVMAILKDESIDIVEKEKLVIKAIDSNIPNIKKLNIIILYLDNTTNKKIVLDKLYASKNKNIIPMTKFIVKNTDNITSVLESVKDSEINIKDKFTISEYMTNYKLSNNDIQICNEIRNKNISCSLASIVKQPATVDKSSKKVTFEF